MCEGFPISRPITLVRANKTPAAGQSLFSELLMADAGQVPVIHQFLLSTRAPYQLREHERQPSASRFRIGGEHDVVRQQTAMAIGDHDVTQEGIPHAIPKSLLQGEMDHGELPSG